MKTNTAEKLEEESEMTPRDVDILQIITAAAESGMPCPTNREIAQIRGHKTPGDTSGAMKRLVAQGYMRITKTGNHRQVHVGGHSTERYKPSAWSLRVGGKGAKGNRPKLVDRLKPTGVFKADSCRYLYGEPKDFDWCGRDTIEGSPYCETHHAICHLGHSPEPKVEPKYVGPVTFDFRNRA